MYGKVFASMFTGSLFGRPAIVFATMNYIISNMRPSRADGQCYVEVNPTLLAAMFATTVEEVDGALDILESPDPASRSKEDDGRRIVLLDDERHSGPMNYRVVNGPKYRAMRDEEERRTYFREAKRKERSKKKPKSKKSTNVKDVNRRPPPSTQAEAEAEALRKDMSVSGETDARIDPEIQELADGYNAICDEWGRGRKHRPETIVEMQPKLRKVLKKLRAEEEFSIAEFFERWKRQKHFFVSDWTGWTLDSLATKPKSGTLTIAEKIWHLLYLGGNGGAGSARGSRGPVDGPERDRYNRNLPEQTEALLGDLKRTASA